MGGFKEALQRIGERIRNKKEYKKELIEQTRIQKIVEDMQKSSNERELERFQHENREELIKHQLEFERKKRQEDIAFSHNPLNVKNIMKAEWSVLKNPNMFNKKSNMFNQEATVMRNNPNLFRNNKKLLRG